jgi:hypothetical protein
LGDDTSLGRAGKLIREGSRMETMRLPVDGTRIGLSVGGRAEEAKDDARYEKVPKPHEAYSRLGQLEP